MMKEVLEKVDATMRLLLLGTLLVAWAVLAVDADPIEIGLRLHSQAQFILEDKRPEEVANFLLKFKREGIEKLLVNEDCVPLRFALPRRSQEEMMKNAMNSMDAARKEALSGQKVSDALAHHFDPDPFGFEEWVVSLRRLATKAGLTNDITLGELQKKVEPPIKMPFVEVQIGAYDAAIVIAVGMAAVLFYLLSLLSALQSRLASKHDSTGIEWIFFHPNPLGPALGGLWLLAPALVFGVGVFVRNESRLLYFLIATGLLVLAAFIIAKALALRKLWKSTSQDGC